jgi:hypothetical protein
MVTGLAAAELTVTDWATRTLLVMLIGYVYFSARRMVSQYDAKLAKHDERISCHEHAYTDHTKLFQKIEDAIIPKDEMVKLIETSVMCSMNNGFGKLIDDRIKLRIIEHEQYK